FNDTIKSPKFSSKARKIILECGNLNWGEINPDIFGSMIQAVVNPEYRSGLGMHYTSVPNIMKVIEPLFLNELNEEFEKSKDSPAKLKKLLYRISKLKIFDPACGSGNFLIISYKELRRLEIRILQQIHELESQVSIVFTQIKLSQFYGIELDDFAHEMAILSLWLAEHQMNKVFIDELHDFGKAKPILPLKEAGHITQGNATRLDWEKACPKGKNDEIYILGNPPYLGRSLRNKNQQDDMDIVFKDIKNYKDLDYIACWFYKGAKFISDCNSALAFVSTNSICQGTQVNLLWPYILKNIHLFFCHIAFKWNNNAKGNAGVSVVIVGLRQNSQKGVNKIFSQNEIKIVDSINPYLTQGANIFIENMTNSISNLSKISLGNAPKDDGALIVSISEYNDYAENNKTLLFFLRKFIGADEFINGTYRYCFWIEDNQKDLASSNPIIKKRLDICERMRISSKKIPTQKLALTPYKFGEIRHKNSASIIIPSVSSEKRDYIPIGFLDETWIISNSAFVIYDAEPFIFAIVTSYMHMVWVRAVAGRLESRLRYSSQLCYNTFPFPEITNKQKEIINLHVFAILEEREKYPEKTLAQLYDPAKMPKGLKEAHHELDLAIERCYRLKPFESDVERLEYLFNEYEKMTIKKDLFSLEKIKKIKIK
ncbi:MAG: class I SAM-dependent DNA methyltransferase, partial [Methylotenera sp.]|nr:class I SAM-dependent DNA methyltransferase [Flavobacterium sp.]